MKNGSYVTDRRHEYIDDYCLCNNGPLNIINDLMLYEKIAKRDYNDLIEKENYLTNKYESIYPGALYIKKDLYYQPYDCIILQKGETTKGLIIEELKLVQLYGEKNNVQFLYQ